MAGTDYPDYPEFSPDKYQIESTGTRSRNNRLALNFTARLSLTYNWDRYFINVMGQYNHFRYRYADQNGGVKDWYINASLGVRF